MKFVGMDQQKKDTDFYSIQRRIFFELEDNVLFGLEVAKEGPVDTHSERCSCRDHFILGSWA